MSGIIILLVSIAVLIIGYVTYGSWLAKKWGIDPQKKTPSHELYDGNDYVPAKAPVLLGHHFSSIAGAGPINGPIQAAIFGWVPVLLWILIGGIFFGAVHDFGSIFASIRHKGQSIGAVISENMGRRAKKLFIIFGYLTLLLVVAAFASIVAGTFNGFNADGAKDATNGTAAMISVLFILIAIVFGFFVYRRNAPLWLSTIIGIAAIVGIIIFGLKVPIYLSMNVWLAILGVYIIIASVTPVWILLQPRDYLSSFLLYGMMAAAIVGIFVTNPAMNLAPVYGFTGINNNSFMFPILFITVACGAISGFHSLVGSGTTSKQLNKETDAKFIGYGGMLIECALAVIALIAVGYLSTHDKIAAGTPTVVFAKGLAAMINTIGGGAKAYNTAYALIILAVSAFALTSLDTATRLARYMFAEFFLDEGETADKTVGVKKILVNPWVGTIVTAGLGISLAAGGYAKIWPLFGAANQLLAGLALLAVAAWLGNIGKNNKMFIIPMVFMLIATITSLCITVYQRVNAIAGGAVNSGNILQAVFAALLVVLSFTLIIEGIQTFMKQARGQKTGVHAK
ncbi:MAG: carbon starvation protein A [Treponema sp.]|jgi:carbon starvation protein|nr:carbon starvation protein A [Treponema sp.]